MKKKTCIHWLIAGGILTFGACQRETALPKDGEPLFRSVSVTLGAAADSPLTKSVVSVDAESFRDAWIFAFDASTGAIYLNGDNPVALHTRERSFDWALPLSPAVMDIYAVVNPDASTRESLETFLGNPSLSRTEIGRAHV